MKNNLSILVPIDFSASAKTAYQFALQLADFLDATIQVLHIKKHELYPHQDAPIRSPEDAHLIENKLQTFVQESLHLDTEDEVTTDVNYEVITSNNVVGEITRLSNDYDLIVTGAKGDNPLNKKLFGSTPSLLAQRAYAPVLIIPQESEFFVPKKLLYASNWESVDKEFIHSLTRWANAFKAQVSFVHVSQEYAIDSFEKIKEEIFDALEEYSNLKFTYLIEEKLSDSPLDGIQQYANKNDIDWIVLVNRQRGFFTNLLGMSMSKSFAENPNYPLLIFQDN